jgi:hypothetical protein
MDSSIVNLREHVLAKVAVEMDTLATARLHEVLRSCAQATAEGFAHVRQGVYRLGSGVGHRPGLELALQQIGIAPPGSAWDQGRRHLLRDRGGSDGRPRKMRGRIQSRPLQGRWGRREMGGASGHAVPRASVPNDTVRRTTARADGRRSPCRPCRATSNGCGVSKIGNSALARLRQTPARVSDADGMAALNDQGNGTPRPLQRPKPGRVPLFRR